MQLLLELLLVFLVLLVTHGSAHKLTRELALLQLTALTKAVARSESSEDIVKGVLGVPPKEE